MNGHDADSVKVATAQFFSGTDEAANAETCLNYMREAAAAGCKVIVFPENAQLERDYLLGAVLQHELAHRALNLGELRFVARRHL